MLFFFSCERISWAFYNHTPPLSPHCVLYYTILYTFVCVCVCAVLVQYDCWPPITTYGDYGFHETRGLLQRREGTTLVHQKEREPRERENDIAGWERGGGMAPRRVWLPSVGFCSLFRVGFLFFPKRMFARC